MTGVLGSVYVCVYGKRKVACEQATGEENSSGGRLCDLLLALADVVIQTIPQTEWMSDACIREGYKRGYIAEGGSGRSPQWVWPPPRVECNYTGRDGEKITYEINPFF